MKKKKKGSVLATIFVFVMFIVVGDSLKADIESSQAEKQKVEQLQAAKKSQEKRLAEEAKKAEEERVAEEERLAEEARIEEEKRAEAERIEQERIQREKEQLETQRIEAERIEAERLEEQRRQEELQAKNNFYVEDGTANHDTSTGYDSPYSDPNEPTITSSTGYVASGNNYMHKTPDCKFIRGKATSTVDANSWSGAVCNCWYY